MKMFPKLTLRYETFLVSPHEDALVIAVFRLPSKLSADVKHVSMLRKLGINYI